MKLDVTNTTQLSVSPPIVVRAPVNTFVELSNTLPAQFPLAAVGPGPLSYQLRLDGTNVPGASATLPGDTSVTTLSLAVPHPQQLGTCHRGRRGDQSWRRSYEFAAGGFDRGHSLRLRHGPVRTSRAI